VSNADTKRRKAMIKTMRFEVGDRNGVPVGIDESQDSNA
jgi:hypothetical protein